MINASNENILSEYLSVFNPNARKYGPEKTSYLDTFHAVAAAVLHNSFLKKLPIKSNIVLYL